jgi:maleylpyruvate isomerase
MRLHGYFRSSAAWRVRIALALKNLNYEYIAVPLRQNAQHTPDYLQLNPQGFVPALQTDDGLVLTQSVAIVEWLDETYPQPALLPASAAARAKVRAFAFAIACDIHPLHNLAVLRRLRAMGHDEASVNDWAREIVQSGLHACQGLLEHEAGPFCFGTSPTLADICLAPALGSARRFGANLAGLERLLAAERACMDLPAFAGAVPGRQPDSE